MAKKEKLIFFSKKRSETLFMILIALFPLLQFFLFYICVNANQIILAFKTYEDSGLAIFAGFNNFKNVIHDMLYDLVMVKALFNSIIFFCASFITISLSILMAFFWWKKVWTSGFIKILALLPNLLSITVFVMIYRYTI